MAASPTVTGMYPQLGPLTGGAQLNISGSFALTKFYFLRFTFSDGVTLPSISCTNVNGAYVICTTVAVTDYGSGACTVSVSVDDPLYVAALYAEYSPGPKKFYLHGAVACLVCGMRYMWFARVDVSFPSFGVTPYGLIEVTSTFSGKDTYEESSITLDVGPMAYFGLLVDAPLVYYSVQEEPATMLPVVAVSIVASAPSAEFSRASMARYTARISIPRALMTSLLLSWSSTLYTDKACYTASTLRFWMSDMTTVSSL